jgi:hypothetical protein
MVDSVTEARRRLPSVQDLERAAALLGVPAPDEADSNTGAPLYRQQAVVLARIANWAALSAQAAEESGGLYFSEAPEPYAYLIETVDEHQGSWRPAGLEGGGASGIEESPDSPATYAVAVMNRYLDSIRARPDDYEHELTGELHVRVSVWPVRWVTAAHPNTAPDPDGYPPARYAHVLKHARISPHAVEIRTPLQVHHHVYSGGRMA